MRTITIKDIYNDVSCINPSVSTISSIGDYIEESSRQVAQSVRDRITKSLPQGTLAHKIITETLKDFFTDKQLWVIAYELQKNEEYVKNLSNEIERREQIAERVEHAAGQSCRRSDRSVGYRLGWFHTYYHARAQLFEWQ